jgi:hypothetical protein
MSFYNILRKNYSHKELGCGEEAENCDGNDPVVRNDCLVKGVEALPVLVSAAVCLLSLQ